VPAATPPVSRPGTKTAKASQGCSCEKRPASSTTKASVARMSDLSGAARRAKAEAMSRSQSSLRERSHARRRTRVPRDPLTHPHCLLTAVKVRSFGRWLDLMSTGVLRRFGHGGCLVAPDVGWRREPALIVGGELQQAPLDQWISSLGEGPDCPSPFPAKLLVHILPRNPSPMGESVGQVA